MSAKIANAVGNLQLWRQEVVQVINDLVDRVEELENGGQKTLKLDSSDVTPSRSVTRSRRSK